MAELKEEDLNFSQPLFSNPVVMTYVEAKSTSSSTVVTLSTSGAVSASEQRRESATQKSKPTEADFGDRLRASMASRNQALQQSEITTQTEASMEKYRSRAQLGGESARSSTTQASSKSGLGGPIQVAKQLQEAAAVKKAGAPSQAKKKMESPPSSEDDFCASG
jgi:hypothetical protein